MSNASSAVTSGRGAGRSKLETLLLRLFRYTFVYSCMTVMLTGCSQRPSPDDGEKTVTDPSGEQEYVTARRRMIEQDLASRDIDDPRVLQAFEAVPRHEFVPEHARDDAYGDRPLPIGQNQTISQPYIVALMTQLVRPQPNDRALDVGTGSGYQAAILAELVSHVYSIEIVPELGNEAESRLERLGYENVTVQVGDGYQGWPDEAPFDVITLAASPPEIPQPLIDQLAPGGRMALPVGSRFQQKLILIEKDANGEVSQREIAPVAFVPMTGEAQR